MKMPDIYIGIGSNLGDKEKNIRRAIGLIKKKCKILKISSLYETEPVGYKKQDLFLNCAIKIKARLNPRELFIFLKSIEKKLGRVNIIKNGPRIIDLDILFYDDKAVKTINLAIPHPRLHKRAFVLEPLGEICNGLVHPILKKSIKELKSGLKSKKWVRIYK